MQTFPILSDDGIRQPIFEIENIYVGLSAIVRLLKAVDGVKDVRRRKPFSKFGDVHIEFTFMNQPYIVWEPWGDNSRYWIGPADMVEGADDVSNILTPEDHAKLEGAFHRYQPPFYRAILGDLLTLRFIKRSSRESKGTH